MLILVDLAVQLKLQAVLGLSYQEVTDCFWDRILHISEHDLEVRVDPLPQLSHKHIATFFHNWWLRLWVTWLSIWASRSTRTSLTSRLLLNWRVINKDILSVVLIVKVVSEEIVLL